MKLKDVMEQTGLERSTSYRLLACLCDEQFVEKDPTTRHYHLGLAAMQLGFASSQRLPLVETYRPVMQRLARISGDTVFLVARQGDYAVCLHREEGSFPVKITTTVVGGIRPLGIGAGGNALLAALGDDEVEQIYQRQRAAFDGVSLSWPALRKSLAQTRKLGYSQTLDIITPGISAVGALIPLEGQPFAAISIGAISPRMPPERRAELGRMLRETLSQPPA